MAQRVVRRWRCFDRRQVGQIADSGNRGGESACKPGSVWDSHSSGTRVAACLERPTREPYGPYADAPLFGLAPSGVCRAAARYRWRGALLPHLFTFTPTRSLDAPHTAATFDAGGKERAQGFARGSLFSVALSIGSRRPGITWHPALRSPDFPPHTYPRARSVRPRPRAVTAPSRLGSLAARG